MSAPLLAPLNGATRPMPIGYGYPGEHPFGFTVPEGKTSDTGYLKLFLSTTHVDLDWIEQPSPFKEQVNGHIGARAAGKLDASPIANIWDTLVASVTVVKEGHPLPTKLRSWYWPFWPR